MIRTLNNSLRHTIDDELAGRVIVVGQGYVGLPLAMAAVAAGYDVVGLDTNIERIKRLAGGESFTADVPDAEVAAALASGRYQATDDIAACADFSVAVITVPTPLTDGEPDLTYVRQAASTLADALTPGALVVLESTTYPGTTEEIVVPILETGSGLVAGRDFFVGYSPERIDPGNPTWTFTTTPKLVSGIDEASRRATGAFYGRLVERTVTVGGTREAELAKLIENTFRHVNVALVNELAMFAAELDIDIWAALDAAATKPFGFMRFTPGPGVGGHCLPIDPSYLSWTIRRHVGRPFRFVELANDINEHMPNYVVQRAAATLNRAGVALSRSTILLVGLAYKRDTADARESPAVRVAELLRRDGARVLAVDPHVDDTLFERLGVTRSELDPDSVAAADIVIVLTDHSTLDYTALGSTTPVLDTRHRTEGPHVEYL